MSSYPVIFLSTAVTEAMLGTENITALHTSSHGLVVTEMCGACMKDVLVYPVNAQSLWALEETL